MKSTSSRTRAWPILCALVVVTVFLAASVAAQQPRVVFATSVTGTDDLGSWPEAGMAVGAAAGDAICSNLAQAAGLDNSANFVAWLSTSTDDAYCRLHGLGGTKAANCGQPQLPVSAGPWVRTDGLAFSESIDRLLMPESLVYYPIAADEFGNPATGLVFTATGLDGAVLMLPTSCSDWTAGSGDFVNNGSTHRGSRNWTASGNSQCNFALRLFCFETGAGPPLDPPAETGALAFVTSVTGTGDLGSWPGANGQTGLAAGDAICQSRAQAAGFEDPFSFKAWLSDSMTDASDRFQHDGPRVRSDGVKVADNLSDILSSTLRAAINVNDQGTYLGNEGVWTATGSDGSLFGGSCQDWTSSSDAFNARTGAASATDVVWTTAFTTQCDWTIAPLYCISDPQIIFADGFESGDVTAWSSSTP